jgi:hypothetical protein
VKGRAAALALSFGLLWAAPAEAGQFYGALAPNPGSIVTCVPNTISVQFSGGNHAVGAGIVTKWFTNGPTSPVSGQMKLVMLRGADPNYTVVGESGPETIAAGSNAFATRIPVQSADRIGVNGGSCWFTDTTTNPSVHYCTACAGGTGSQLVLDQTDLDRQVNARVYVEQDGDGDGWGDESQDNCRGLANTSQANADADGSGDDCDIDDDNDSVLDAEDAFPLDPSEARDTDGDGVGDNADLDDDNDGVSDVDEARSGTDPRNAASRPSAPVSLLRPDLLFPTREGSLRAPVLRAPRAIGLAALRKGVKVSATTMTRARLDFELRVTPTAVHVSRFELRVASRSLGLGRGRRSVRLKPDGRLLRGARRFTLQLRVRATDQGGNRAVATRTIKVR